MSLHNDVLVIDDTSDDLKLISEILTNAGFEVRASGNAYLALRSIQAKMPGINGYDLCR